MDTKYLLIDCSTQYESLFAVVTWTPQTAKLMLKRTGLAFEMKSADDDFAGLEFYDHVDMYEGSVEDLVDFDDEDVRYALLPEEPMLEPAFMRVRVGTCLLNVGVDSFNWQIFPKHGGGVAESRMLYKDNEELFA